ncbi:MULTISPECIES: branched-chain amino acid transporter permease [unclassified Aeromicrobium]|uniref:branched-chain amino acid transporter permease n=1 Tax=unclassified Aeromicrobium TaxID=2633570 RepID=UPI00396B3920
MPSPGAWYIAGVLATVFTITLALRAVPFAILGPLRESTLVKTMATWMPVGILAILAASTFLTSTGDDRNHALHAIAAVGVTAAVHLLAGRRTLLSVGIGTLAYVLVVRFL